PQPHATTPHPGPPATRRHGPDPSLTATSQPGIVGSLRMKLAALALSAFLLASCAPKIAGQPKPTAPPTPSPAAQQPSPPSASPSPASTHVFVIVMENRTSSQVSGNGYIATLAAQYGVASNYHGVSHHSLPNYLALTSGSTWSIADDAFHALPAGGLGAELTTAGISWRAYMEGMTRTCFNSPYPYALKHDPFAYYGSKCPPQVVPFTQFATDMAGDAPRFVWITPNLCHDGHDCSNAVAEAWLAQTVPVILGSSAWRDNGVLFITWDEGEDTANSVLTLVVQPNPPTHESSQPYDHYSLLATIEDQLGVPRLGLAAQATPMSDLLAMPSPPRQRIQSG
ncbi:MAG: alkaline phosphatase family protein, partial [Candidatus Dormibacteraceae bacterium]